MSICIIIWFAVHKEGRRYGMCSLLDRSGHLAMLWPNMEYLVLVWPWFFYIRPLYISHDESLLTRIQIHIYLEKMCFVSVMTIIANVQFILPKLTILDLLLREFKFIQLYNNLMAITKFVQYFLLFNLVLSVIYLFMIFLKLILGTIFSIKI